MNWKPWISCVILMLAGCGANGPIQQIAPFSDRPTEIYRFQYTTVNVTGVVWSFEQDGTYVSFGGPLGLVHENSRRDAVLVSGTGIELVDSSDVTATDSEHIKALISAAEEYCADQGFGRHGNSGAGIHTNNGALYLVSFCAPGS